ncbi:hypothetical protein ACFQS2_03470 [Brachybacterium sp. GCM10030267]|uniref:hypothetical protein n=1 Tax=Brachybacterium sp. GCM10030267 TaxID=3273381 RepID=UPI003622359D
MIRKPAWYGYSAETHERRRQVRSQIRDKPKRIARLREERSALLTARASTHQRNPDEYQQPIGELRMSTWEVARSIDRRDERPFEELPLMWAGVRGSAYSDPVRWFYTPGKWFNVWGELVPEPFNRHDDHALAVDLDGIRLGYAPARYARYAHSYVSALNGRGSRVMVPLRYRSDYVRGIKTLIASGLVALPTLDEFKRLFPSDEEYLRLLAPLWEALGSETRAQIARDRFHLTEETLAAVIKLRHLAPEAGIPPRLRPNAVPRGVNHFLKHKRFETRIAEAHERQLRGEKIIAAFREGWRQADISRQLNISASVVKRALDGAGVDTSIPQVNPVERRTRSNIVIMLENGIARREIMKTLGVSSHTVTTAAHAAGLEVRSEAGLNDYSRARMRERLARCRRAFHLQQSGASRAEVAQDLGVSAEMTKTYLSDGKFYADPKSNWERLETARAVRANGMTIRQASSGMERRAIRDGNMLDLIGEPWL